jgi:predicted nucleic acid-binding Zn ribbon protein
MRIQRRQMFSHPGLTFSSDVCKYHLDFKKKLNRIEVISWILLGALLGLNVISLF